MNELYGAPLVEVTRGKLAESVHSVAACAIDKTGDVVFALGEIDTPVFLRSSAKPFIAATALKYGAAERYGLDQRELAVMAGSHSGEPYHIAAVRSILEKIGLPESALQCGAHAPYNIAAALALERCGEPFTAVHNNCSGKHAGILALCLLLGSDIATYMDIENPAQQAILHFCARLTGDDARTWPLGIDGCGIPVFATPLRRAALAFMRFATLHEVDPSDASALRMVRDAMIAAPLYVSGTGEFDAALMHAGAGEIACKAGAEGVECVSALTAGVGLALKVIDGTKRAVAPATMAALDGLGVLDPSALVALERFARPELRNRAGRVVGEIRARRAIP
nr:asparaginase [Candidatus Eremiobacteraeota bacterium]